MRLQALTAFLGLLLLWMPAQAQEASPQATEGSQVLLFSQAELDQLIRYALANGRSPSGLSRQAVERDLSTFLSPEQVIYLILMDEETRRWERESILDRPVAEDMKDLQHKTLREWDRLYGR